jgi:hypothetical protein
MPVKVRPHLLAHLSNNLAESSANQHLKSDQNHSLEKRPGATSRKTKGPASRGQYQGGIISVARSLAAHSPSATNQQVKVPADLWPNLAKHVQTFRKFAPHLYF